MDFVFRRGTMDFGSEGKTFTSNLPAAQPQQMCYFVWPTDIHWINTLFVEVKQAIGKSLKNVYVVNFYLNTRIKNAI